MQRLTEAVATIQPDTGEPQIETEGWDYDPNGNRILDNLNPGSWVYDINDRLQTSPEVTYGYDEAGHTVSKTEGGVTTTYEYNAEGRLARIEDASQNLIAEYQHDPLGRRIRKQTQSEIIYFHYADEGFVGEFDGTGSSIRQYGYQPDATWTTDPIYQKTAGGYAYYQNDHLGTPQQLIQKSGAKVWEGEYHTFGELVAEEGSWGNRLRFPGQYYDQETGNYYNYFRDYDPTTGRYLQSDPIGIWGGYNFYRYGWGNPLTVFDPLGLKCKFFKQGDPEYKATENTKLNITDEWSTLFCFPIPKPGRPGLGSGKPKPGEYPPIDFALLCERTYHVKGYWEREYKRGYWGKLVCYDDCGIKDETYGFKYIDTIWKYDKDYSYNHTAPQFKLDSDGLGIGPGDLPPLGRK